jgi:hypothetical protein
MIEVDVRQQHRSRALVSERGQQRRQTRSRAWIDKYVANLPTADDALAPQMAYVDQPHPVGLY